MFLLGLRLAAGERHEPDPPSRRNPGCDAVGYSRLIGADESGTLQAFKTIKAELFDPAIAAHTAGWSRTTGDGFLVESSSVVTASMLRDRVASRDGLEQRRDGRRWYHRARCSAGDGDIFVDGVNGYSHRTCYVLQLLLACPRKRKSTARTSFHCRALPPPPLADDDSFRIAATRSLSSATLNGFGRTGIPAIPPVRRTSAYPVISNPLSPG